jgi:hypothetical protein
MINRPCRTDADLKLIWQLLLPGTPVPACDAPENSAGEVREDAASSRPDEKPRSNPGAR